jgi:hypothetical protein
MKKIMLVISGALLGVILFQFLFYKCESGKKDKDLALVREDLQKCLNAPVKTDTVIVTNVLKDTIYLKFTHKVVDTVKVSDAINWIDQTVEQRLYFGTYEHPQFEVNWSALVTGTLDTMTINPPSLIKSMVITKEKTIDISKPPAECKEKSHLFANVGGFYSKEVQGIDCGLMYVHRSGFGVRAGIGTDFEHLLYNGGVVLRLK